LWIKPTDALKSNFIGITTLRVTGSQPFCPSTGVLSRTSALIYILCSCDDRLLPRTGWNYVSSCSW